MSTQSMLSIEEQRWGGRVRAGCTVTFWSLLVPRLVTNVIAFSLPFVGAGPVYLKWARAIHTAGALPLLIGVAMLTAPPPLGRTTWLRWSGWLLRIVVVVEGGCRLLRSATDFVSVPAISAYTERVAASNDLAFVVVAATYLTAVNHRLGVTHMHREIWTACLVFVCMKVADWGLDAGGAGWYSSLPVVVLGMLYATVMAVWGLLILWRFRRVFCRFLDHRCLRCGYSLANLLENRCPECGLPS